MKKLIAAAAVAGAMAFAPANAVLIDFAAEADANGERALTNPGGIIINGIGMTITSFDTNDTPMDETDDVIDYFPYLDKSSGGLPGGLGVCQVITATRQCTPGNDDNITMGEGLQILFGGPGVDINGFVFRDETHNLLDAGNDGNVIYRINGGGPIETTFSALSAMAFMDVMSIDFNFDGTQFYVSALDVDPIPVPAALPLLLSGLAGLGFASRRRKNA